MAKIGSDTDAELHRLKTSAKQRISTDTDRKKCLKSINDTVWTGLNWLMPAKH